MLTHYIFEQMGKAKFKKLADKTYFGTIPGVSGVWANARTMSECKKELQEVFEDWMVLSLKKDKKIRGFSFTLDKRYLVKNA